MTTACCGSFPKAIAGATPSRSDAELLKDRAAPVTGGIPVELNAGDGVIYINYLNHTGSNYTTKKRRTLHGGHAIYGTYPETGSLESLAPWARERFESYAARGECMKDATEEALPRRHRKG